MSKPTIYQHYDYGSPIVENTYGTFAKMLKAVLVTGYSEITGVSIEQYEHDFSKMYLISPIQLSVNSHMHIKTGSVNFPENYKILVREHKKTEKNLYHYVCEHESTESFPLDSNVTIWKKPLGWTLKFEDLTKNKYVFENATGWCLRIHDEMISSGWNTSWAKSARVALGRDMYDIDTFKEPPTPYSEIQPSYTFDSFDWSGIRPSMCQWLYSWYQGFSSYTPNSAPQNGTRHWSIIGDENTFYLFISPFNNWSKTYHAYGVTAIKSNYENDDTAFAIWGSTIGRDNYLQWYNTSQLFCSHTDGLNNNNNEPHYKNAFIYRTIGQSNFNYPTQCKTISLCGIGGNGPRSGRTGWAWDDVALKSISIFPLYVIEKGHRLRGELVGAKWIPQNIDSLASGGHNSNMITETFINNIERKYAIFNFRNDFYNDNGANYVAMDLDEDWSEHVYQFPTE